MAQRLGITTEKGKYYLMEKFMVLRKKHLDHEAVNEMVRYNLRADRMLIAGPFETKETAEKNRRERPEAHRLDVWLC